jgi:hypothetical protein
MINLGDVVTIVPEYLLTRFTDDFMFIFFSKYSMLQISWVGWEIADHNFVAVEVHKASTHSIQEIWSMLLREKDEHEIISEPHQPIFWYYCNNMS